MYVMRNYTLTEGRANEIKVVLEARKQDQQELFILNEEALLIKQEMFGVVLVLQFNGIGFFTYLKTPAFVMLLQ